MADFIEEIGHLAFWLPVLDELRTYEGISNKTGTDSW